LSDFAKKKQSVTH